MRHLLYVRNVRGKFFHSASFHYIKTITGVNSVSTISYIDTTPFEVFPPARSAPIFISANVRKRIRSFLNSFTLKLDKNELDNEWLKISSSSLIFHRIQAICEMFRILSITNSETKINQSFTIDIDLKRDLLTMLCSLYGVKHFKVHFFYRLPSRCLAIYRYFLVKKKIGHILAEGKYDSILLTNGRDVAGLAVQREAKKRGVPFFTLERAIPRSETKYVVFRDSLHLWWIKQEKCKRLQKQILLSRTEASLYMQQNFGTHSKYWRGESNAGQELAKLPKPYAVFFLGSEREWVGFEDSNGRTDDFDQSAQLLQFIAICGSLKLPVVVRLHPNFSESHQSRMEARYWTNLLKGHKDTWLISNNSNLDSYELAKNASISGVYRSSLAAEFAWRGIPFLCTAESAFTHNLKGSLAIEPAEMRIIIENALSGEVKENEDLFWIVFASYWKYIGIDLV